MGHTIKYPDFVNKEQVESHEEDKYRYLLKIPFNNAKCNTKILCVILKNPSTAGTKDCDTTVSKVSNVAYNSGYSEVIILNLFPYRSTDAKGVINFYKQFDFDEIMDSNLQLIENTCKDKDTIFAWGTNTISGAKKNRTIYNNSIKNVISVLNGNTYYVESYSMDSNDEKVIYPLHGLRWSNNSELTKFL